jgi:3-phenylpropionate/trans-cinnamate dioxygenase ferredoxin subunit
MPLSPHDIGPLEDFIEAQAQRVEIGRHALLVVRQGHTVYALRDICPHQGARLSDGMITGTPLTCRPGDPLSYSKQGQIIVCPWHGWEYDLTTGRSLVNPQRVRVRSYTTQIKAGRVLVTLEHSS